MCLLVLALAPTASVRAAADPSAVSVDAAFYLNVALNIMQRSSINKDRINWPALRAAALERAAGARTFAETYPAIAAALAGLQDGHSYFVPPAAGRSPSAASAPTDSGRVVGSRFGYVSVQDFSGGDPRARAARLQRLVQSVAKASPCGWIVDLRSTNGGDLFSALTGIGPILGDGTAGRMVYPSGLQGNWFYQRGAAGVVKAGARERTTIVQVRPVVLDDSLPYVAVLIGPLTARSGEALAISFRGRPNTRSFGTSTAGLSTHNDDFRLRDGARLSITTALLADRTGRRYGGVVQPDLAVDGPDEPQPGIDDAVIQAAARWLTIQPSCARAMAGR